MTDSQRRTSDSSDQPPAQKPDVFARVREVTGVALTPAAAEDASVRETLNTLLARLDEAEKARDTDALTNLFNRGAWDREMARQIELKNRHKDQHPPITIVMFDINDFKQVNTEHTHAGGDHAIKHVGRVLAKSIEEQAAEHVAEVLGKSLRKTDFVARLGGDEFAVIMYDTPESDALTARLEAIRQKIIDTPCQFNGKQIKLGVAYGCHMLVEGDTIPSIIADFSTKMSKHKKVVKGVGTASGVAAAPSL